MDSSKIDLSSKEQIRARILQNAVKIWGLKSVNSINPFVGMLAEVFSDEIFRLSSAVQAWKEGFLGNIARTLTPSIYTAPQPAHAVAYSYPVNSAEILPNYSEFFVQRSLDTSAKAGTDVKINISFTPVDSIRLVKMRVSLLFAGNTCYVIDKEQNKIETAKIPSDAIPYRGMTIGIDAADYTEETLPSILAFYCSNPAFGQNEFVYKLLPYVAVKANGRELKIRSGLSYEQSASTSDEKRMRPDALKSRMEENIKNIYKDNFMEVSGISNAVVTEEIPENLQFIRSNAEIMQSVSKRMIWLEMKFPPQFTPEILEGYFFSLNAFPVYNRAWKSRENSTNITGNNVPLPADSGEYFLYMDEVTDSAGNRYEEIPFTHTGGFQKGAYTLHYGGMIRFDERKALDRIDDVLELSRDEVAAFGVFNRDRVVNSLTNMAEQMKELVRSVGEMGQDINREINYAVVEPMDETSNFRAAYWVSQGSLANHLKAKTELTQNRVKASNIAGRLILLTDTVGGQKKEETDAVQTYQYLLTSRDKIITLGDVKNFCRMALGHDLKEVEVKRTVIISDKPKEGFITAIRALIVPKSYASHGKSYWNNLAVSIKKQMEVRSTDSLEYIVEIMDKDEEK